MLHIPDEHPLVQNSEQKLTIPLRTIGKKKYIIPGRNTFLFIFRVIH